METRYPNLDILILAPSGSRGLPTQAMELGRRFISDGARVVSSSSRNSRWLRPVDMFLTTLRHGFRSDVAVLNLYCGIGTFAYATILLLTARLIRLPVVVVIHDGTFPQFRLSHPDWTRRMLRLGAAVATPSAFLQAEVEALNLAATVIPNILDLEALPFRQRIAARPALLWARAFHEYYNPMLAIQVAASVRSTYPAVSLKMAGREMGLEAACRRAVSLEEVQIDIVGQLSREQLVELAGTCDIYLNTTVVDNAPLTVMEMQALGLPVVATDVGGIRCLIEHDVDGLLVPPDDAIAMGNAVVRLLTDDALVQRLSLAGRARVVANDWNSVRRCWISLFEKIC